MNSFKLCREKRGLTQKEVAIELKISIQAISYWETGERMPSYEKLFQLADLYHATTDELLGRAAPVISGESTFSFSNGEMQLIIDYRRLSADNQNSILKNVQFLLSMQNEEKETKKSTIA